MTNTFAYWKNLFDCGLISEKTLDQIAEEIFEAPYEEKFQEQKEVGA